MRSLTALVLVALLAVAAPAEAASRSELTLTSSHARVAVAPGGSTTVAIDVDLALHDFSCINETAFPVALTARAEGNATAVLSEASVTFVVPAESYLIESYRGNATVNLTVGRNATSQPAAENASVQVTATFSGGDTECVSAGGFDPALAVLVVEVDAAAPAANATPPANETMPNGTFEDGGNATLDGANATADANETPEPTQGAANGTTSTGEPCPQGVQVDCGYIGEYEGNRSPNESKRSVPSSAGLALVAAACAAVAAARLRRR